MLSSTNLWVHFSRWSAYYSPHFSYSHLRIHFIFLINLRTYNLDLIDRTELSLPFDKYTYNVCDAKAIYVAYLAKCTTYTPAHQKSVHVNTVDGWKWKKTQKNKTSQPATCYLVLKYSKVDINICARLIYGTCKLYAQHIDIGDILVHIQFTNTILR